jgi:hypothetical protein
MNFSRLAIKSYSSFEIPVIFSSLTPSKESKNITAIPSFLKVNLNLGSNLTKQILLVNQDNIPIDKIEASQSSFYTSSSSSESINLTFTPEKQGVFNETLKVTYSKNNISKILEIPLEIYIFSQSANISGTTTYNTSQTAKSCSFYGGSLCSFGQTCEGTASYTSDGYCCIGSCLEPEVPKPEEGYGWLIGIIIILVLGAAGFFVYKKYKRIAPQKPEETISKKSELYQNRMSGKLIRS